VNNPYILDACAIIAFLLNEPGGNEVHSLFRHAERGEVQVFMHNLNLLEIYYGLRRAYGEPSSSVRLEYIKQLPITFLSQVGGNSFIEAGRLKARYKISLADAVLLSEASILRAIVVTADHHELDSIERTERIKFFWIR
jgi:PIN domain nuclease of toxin-antitoxin system